MGDVFVTGVTGFLGRYVAVRLLARGPSVRLWCLVRARDEAHATERLLRSLRRAVGADRAAALLERVQPVLGDLTVERLGLDAETLGHVAAHCTSFLHSAADVRFDQSIEDARKRNVYGTQQVVAVAREAQSVGKLERFDWVGTAFVGGLRTDRVLESELEHDAGWKNAYEQSKYEAESWLRQEAADLPLTVFRPSIIVGESVSGETSNFGMLYWPVQIYAKGWWRTIVGRPETPVDLVPVDFVADALELLSRPDRPVGATYHLAAGAEGNRSIEQLAELCRSYFGGKAPRYVEPAFFMRWVRPVLNLFLWGKRGRVLKDGGSFFVPYFSGNPIFDVSATELALEGSGLSVPTVEDYFGRLLDYCVSTDFGRRPAIDTEPSTPSSDAA